MTGISFPLGSGTNRWKVIGPDGVETRHTARNSAHALKLRLGVTEFPGKGGSYAQPRRGQSIYTLTMPDGTVQIWDVRQLP